MPPPKPQSLPELFFPEDPKWASRAAQRGEIRRLARGLYSTNLDEPAEQLLRRRWYDVAALYFPGAVVTDRSAFAAGPTSDGSLFLDSGPRPARPRPVALPGLTLRPRSGPGPIEQDMPFVDIYMASQPRAYLDNMRPSRERKGAARTLRREELEQHLDRLARTGGADALNDLRDQARRLAPALDADRELRALDDLIGSLQGTRDTALATRAGRARQAGLAYDTDRLALFETLRAELARLEPPVRTPPADPQRLFAFFEAYFSNWIEGTEFEVSEAERIVFEGQVPADRPADAHDVQSTFDVVTDPALRATVPANADEFESLLKLVHERIMSGRPETRPGNYKRVPNRAGATEFVAPDLVRGTLREGFTLYQTLPAGMPRAVYVMFLVSEVHPFVDGNGRLSRIFLNAELTAAGQCRVMIPLSYRDEYLTALRALTRNNRPRPIWRAIDRAQRWAASMTWEPREQVIDLLRQTNALVDPREAGQSEVHLLDPPHPSA